LQTIAGSSKDITEWGGKNEDQEMSASTHMNDQIATRNWEIYAQASEKNGELACDHNRTF
jgi:hypothetical protein